MPETPGQAAYEAYWRTVHADETGPFDSAEAWEHCPPWAQAAWEAAGDAAVKQATQ